MPLRSAGESVYHASDGTVPHSPFRRRRATAVFYVCWAVSHADTGTPSKDLLAASTHDGVFQASEGLALLHEGFESGSRPDRFGSRHKIERRFADQFLGLVAQDVARTRTNLGVGAAGIDLPDPISESLSERAKIIPAVRYIRQTRFGSPVAIRTGSVRLPLDHRCSMHARPQIALIEIKRAELPDRCEQQRGRSPLVATTARCQTRSDQNL